MKNRLLILLAATALVSNVSVYAATNSVKHKMKPKQTCTATKTYASYSRTWQLEQDVQSLKAQVAELLRAKEYDRHDLGNMAEIYAHGPAVVTTSYFGLRSSEFSVWDILVNLPSVNEDLQILRTRQKMDCYAKEHCITIPDHPILSISGGVEGQVISNTDIHNRNTVDVDLTRAELDFIAEASPWATAAMFITYDNGGIIGLPNRVNNSRLYLSRGFMTIGQLNKCPVYFTLGQIYLPFGRYFSYRVTSPTTKAFGRILQRTALLGFDYHGFNGQIYGFQGETNVPGETDLGKRGGVNLGYKYKGDFFSFEGITGLTGNIAESQGMQINGKMDPNFRGFAYGKTIHSRVPAFDAYAKVGLKPFSLVGEYVTATQSFDPADLTFNNNGAKPSALDLEAAYDFNLFCKPNNLAIGYGRTWEALGVNLPKHDYFAEYSIQIWQSTVESIEYRHYINYSTSDMATGNNPIVSDDNPLGQIPITGIGGSSNAITFQLGIYF